MSFFNRFIPRRAHRRRPPTTETIDPKALEIPSANNAESAPDSQLDPRGLLWPEFLRTPTRTQCIGTIPPIPAPPPTVTPERPRSQGRDDSTIDPELLQTAKAAAPAPALTPTRTAAPAPAPALALAPAPAAAGRKSKRPYIPIQSLCILGVATLTVVSHLSELPVAEQIEKIKKMRYHPPPKPETAAQRVIAAYGQNHKGVPFKKKPTLTRESDIPLFNLSNAKIT